MDTAERLSAARSVLMQAETAVGLNVGRSLRTEDPEWADCECWDTPEPLSEIFPSGLRQGMTIGLQGSRLASLLLAGVARCACPVAHTPCSLRRSRPLSMALMLSLLGAAFWSYAICVFLRAEPFRGVSFSLGKDGIRA